MRTTYKFLQDSVTYIAPNPQKIPPPTVWLVCLGKSKLEFSFWWNHTRSPGREVWGRGTNPRRVRPRGYRFQRPPAERSEARLRRAKRGLPAERSEAPPRLRRAKRGHAKVIGRSPLQKNSKRFHQKAQGNHLFINGFLFYRGYLINILFSKKKITEYLVSCVLRRNPTRVACVGIILIILISYFDISTFRPISEHETYRIIRCPDKRIP